MAKKINVSRNLPNWHSSKNDYVLVFCFVDGYWRELSQNVPEFSNMLLSDYLDYMQIYVPDYTQFIRINDPIRHMNFEFRSVNSQRVRIDVSPLF